MLILDTIKKINDYYKKMSIIKNMLMHLVDF